MLLRVCCILMLVAACAWAQEQPAVRFEPVDQAVGDLDGLSTSLRQMQKGIHVNGEQSRLYRVQPLDPANPNAAGGDAATRPTYYRSSPGLTAQVDRLDYVVRGDKKHSLVLNIAPKKDHQYYEFVTANTVFILRPMDPALASGVGVGSEALEQEDANDRRINGRIDRRLNRRVELTPAYRSGTFNPSGDPSQSLSIR